MQDTLMNIWNQAWAFFQAHPIVGMQLLIGLAAGWLASLVLGGKGLLRDLIIGVLGSFVGSYLQQLLQFHFGLPQLAEQIAVATVGALVIIVVGRVMFR